MLNWNSALDPKLIPKQKRPALRLLQGRIAMETERSNVRESQAEHRRWSVEVAALPSEPRLIGDVLANVGVTLDLTQHPPHITSEQFEAWTTADAVLSRATQIFDAMRMAPVAGNDLRCSIGNKVYYCLGRRQ